MKRKIIAFIPQKHIHGRKSPLECHSSYTMPLDWSTGLSFQKMQHDRTVFKALSFASSSLLNLTQASSTRTISSITSLANVRFFHTSMNYFDSSKNQNNDANYKDMLPRNASTNSYSKTSTNTSTNVSSNNPSSSTAFMSSTSNTLTTFIKYILLFPLLFIMYFIFGMLFPLFLQNFTLKLEIDNDDPSFQWFMNWLSQLNYSKSCTHLSIYSIRNTNSHWFIHFDQVENEKKDILLEENPSLITSDELLIPAPGSHIFQYNGAWIYLHYDKSSSSTSSQQKSKETITIWVLNSSRKFLMDLILDARSIYEKQRKNRTCIYMPDLHLISWEEMDRKEPRPLNTVFLKQGYMEALCKDLNTFRERKQFYKSKGIPYRRGYLLYGVPGSGKTSTVMGLAGHYGYHICVLNVGASGMNDESLNRLMQKAPKDSILLLEDIDSCIPSVVDHSARPHNHDLSDEKEIKPPEFDDAEFYTKFKMMEYNSDSRVTLSGLLNALDGVHSQEDRIIFCTSNHPERLQSALIRPGRIDFRLNVGNADVNQIKALFYHFFNDSITDTMNADKFVSQLSMYVDTEIPPSSLSSYFLGCETATDAIERVEELARQIEL